MKIYRLVADKSDQKDYYNLNYGVFFFLLKSAISLAIIIIHLVGAAAMALQVRAFAPQA